MAELDNIRRIMVEDFEEDHRPTVGRLAGILNHHMEQVHNAFDKRIDFINMNQEVIEITIVVNASGQVIKSETNPTLVENPQFSSTTLGRSIGSHVIRAINTTDSSIYPDSAVQIHFSQVQNGLFKINKINGLQANNTYKLRFVLFGD